MYIILKHPFTGLTKPPTIRSPFGPNDLLNFAIRRRRGMYSDEYGIHWSNLWAIDKGIFCNICTFGLKEGKFVTEGGLQPYCSKLVQHFNTSMLFICYIDMLY